MIDPTDVVERAQADIELAYKLRGFAGTIRVDLGDLEFTLDVTDGKVTGLADRPGEPPTVTLAAPASFWQQALKAVPVPGFESITVGRSAGLRLEGDLYSVLAPYQGALSRLFSLLRASALAGQPTEVPWAEDPFVDSDNAVGRYVRYRVAGVEYRVFYEEAGTGDTPVLLVHTAGADSREYRHVLADPELQQKYRLLAMDLPYHGRSLPPTSVRWWEQDYQPSKELLMDWIVGFIDALGIMPVFVGCSVGGQLASDLCAHHPDKIRAAIGINGLHNMAPYSRFDNTQFRDPRVSPELWASMNLGATSPLAPEPFRRELYWIYNSNAPGVYAGDNDYFMHGHDLRVDGDLIDTGLTPLIILAGEYDPSARSPEIGGQKIADTIPGSQFTVMRGAGHFAPCDDPLAFREWFIPALDAVLAQSDRAGKR